MNFEKLVAVRDATLSNADSLLRAAKLLDGRNLDHIRFHLAVISLEEVGKSVLIGMRHIAQVRGDAEPPFVEHLDDHIKKLFWALWGPSFTNEQLTPQQFEEYVGLARRLHERRLIYLYSDPEAPTPPGELITADEANQVVGLAEARYGFERAHKLVPIEGQRLENLRWFLGATNDPDKRGAIFGAKSLEKLRELGSVADWVDWLHAQFDANDANLRALFEKEINRTPPSDSQQPKPKWRVRLTLYSHSHSIRQKALNQWNGRIHNIKLHATGQHAFVRGKKNELKCEFTLPESVSASALWYAAWGLSRAFAVALNIATRGFFWWYVPSDTDGFYDEIFDLENNAGIKITEGPRLEIAWGHLALKEQDMALASVVLAYLMHLRGKAEEAPLDAYITGLTHFSKIDFHLRCEANAFESFWNCMRDALRIAAQWDGQSDYRGAVRDAFAPLLPDTTDLEKHIQLGVDLNKARSGGTIPQITLTEVVGMKLYCDLYLTLRAREWAGTQQQE